MTGRALQSEKGRLWGKVVYIYLCFFSMAVAELLSGNIIYGAALYFSLAALFHVWRFSARTPEVGCAMRGMAIAAKLFFILALIYLLFVYPILFPCLTTVNTAVLIALPVIALETDMFVLRRRAQKMHLSRCDIAVTSGTVALIFTVIAGLVALPAGPNVFGFVLGGTAIGMALSFFRQTNYLVYTAEYRRSFAVMKDVRQIRSARLYDGMVISSGAALNIFAFTYILYFIFLRDRSSVFGLFVTFCGLALVLSAVYLGTSPVGQSSLFKKIGKNTVFVLGTAIAIFSIYLFADSWYLGGFSIAIQTVLLLIGLTLQMTAAYRLEEDVFLVVKLYDEDADPAAFRQRSDWLGVWTSVLSEAVFTIVLVILISDPMLYMMDAAQLIEYAPIVGSSVIAIPTMLLFVSLFYSAKQPLTKKFGRRLWAYERLKKRGEDNPDMKKRLTAVLISKYKKRIGVHIIRMFLKPIMSNKVEGQEHVADLPGIFVFNHRELYGPIAAIVFLPYDVRPWIFSKMIDKDEIYEHIYEGTFCHIRWMPKWLRRWIPKVISPVVVWALRSFDPIPVYRGATANVIKTFSLSITCLNAGDSILLFPENPEDTYEEQVSAFYRGFANLGRLYYKRTGNKLSFYPVYASKRHHVLRIGEGVRYNPKGGKQEKDRIVETLEMRMRALQSKDDISP